jgi:drug/metabolite transporter (DMT)-like permease
VTTRKAYVLIAVAACSWGTWRFVLLAAERLSARGLDARVEAAVVMLVITLFGFLLLPFDPRDRDAMPARTAIDWVGVAWLGVADAMNVLLLFAAYAKTTVAIAVTTHYLAPILVAVSAPLLLKERSDKAWMGALGGAVGLALLLRPWSADLGKSDLMGAAAGAGSAVFYASNVLVNKRLVAKFSAIELMAYHGVVATPLLALVAPIRAFASLTPLATLVLVVGGIVPGALGGILFIRGLRLVRAAHASTLTLLEPLVAVAIAVIAFGERLPLTSWLGASIVLSCAAGVAYPSRQ